MKITVDKNKTYQTMRGFGASGAWGTSIIGGWDNTDEKSGLSVRDRACQLLYSKTDGIGLSIYRYNIGGGSAFSGKGTYSNKARAVESFYVDGKYDWSKDKNSVYIMKKCVEYGADEVIFFVNSPIEQLTKNGMAHTTPGRAWTENLDKKNYGKFAEYCLDVTEHFLNEGIPVKYLSPVNEPLWVWTGGQEGCHYRPSSVKKVFSVFAKELKSRENLKGLKLSGAENGDIRWFNKMYTRAVLGNKDCKDLIDGIDIHSYFLNPIKPFFSDRVAYLKRFNKFVKRHYPDKSIVMSEWTHMQGGRDKGMNSGLETAKIIYEDLVYLEAVSWQHWIAFSEVDYCDGLIYLNEDTKTVEETKRLYVTGNFSKYIPIGAKRVNVETDDETVKTVAFSHNGKTIVICINPTEQGKQVDFGENKNALVAVTDENNDLAERTEDLSKKIKLTARSVTTFVY